MSKNEHLKQISEIKQMMEENSKFLSLSGLSGVFAGVVALVGAGVAYKVMANYGVAPFANQRYQLMETKDFEPMIIRLVLVALAILITALIGGFVFTYIKSKKQGAKLWNRSARQLLINLFIPLGTGGLVVGAMIIQGLSVYTAPLTLVFYGLSLLNASKYTLRDIRYLAICQLVLGVAGIFFLGYGFLFWILGFGVMHILYGIIMYVKYERK